MNKSKDTLEKLLLRGISKEEKLTRRVTITSTNGTVSFRYPDHYTQQQRGFTPPVSAKLHFGKMRSRSRTKSERIVSKAELNAFARYKDGDPFAKRLIHRSLHSLYGIK